MLNFEPLFFQSIVDVAPYLSVMGNFPFDFVLTAGDNAAESVASVSKTQLRRMNLLRSVSSDPIEHRSLLAAHYLNKSPGLESVLRSLAMHRQKASSGLLSPRECFQKPLWKA